MSETASASSSGALAAGSRPSRRRSLSLSQRGAWGQVAVATLLLGVLPTLILVWVWESQTAGESLSALQIGAAVTVVFILMASGYLLLLKYPVSIVRLRGYLRTLAEGHIPTNMALSEDEDDLAAIQYYMEHIVRMAEERIRMLEDRHARQLEAERTRVMIESIGAMCHHVGQPATILSLSLHRLRNLALPQEASEPLAECQAAFDEMTGTIDALRGLAHYRTEPYLNACPHPHGGSAERIIKV